MRFCLVFKRESTSVSAMRRVLGDTLRRLGVNEESVVDILLAASEACTNVIRHAARAVDQYVVVATVDTTGCRVEVIDSGDGCRRPTRRRVAATAESGRGFEVMRACVDCVSLSSAPGRGTVVTLDKKFLIVVSYRHARDGVAAALKVRPRWRKSGRHDARDVGNAGAVGSPRWRQRRWRTSDALRGALRRELPLLGVSRSFGSLA